MGVGGHGYSSSERRSGDSRGVVVVEAGCGVRPLSCVRRPPLWTGSAKDWLSAKRCADGGLPPDRAAVSGEGPEADGELEVDGGWASVPRRMSPGTWTWPGWTPVWTEPRAMPPRASPPAALPVFR